MIQVKALLICENLLEYITREKVVVGHVHSVFNNACNIETNNKFITLLNKDKGMAPMSAVVDNGEEINFRGLGIKQNVSFKLNVNGIMCHERNLYIELQNAQRWYPGVIIKPIGLLKKDILENIKTIETVLNTHGKLYGIGPLINILGNEFQELKVMQLPIYFTDNNFEFIKYRFENFIRAALKGDVENIAERAESIIGFGVGLTPSIDDFISGLMISFIYLGSYYNLNISNIYEFNKELIKKGLNKTTKVSSEMLKHASIGETNEAVRELMQSILYETDQEKIIKALIKTISFGETSGSDTVLGIYIGCKIITNLKYRRAWLNEAMCGY